MGNHIGEILRVTTFGESHGPGIGAVVDGCPAGLEISMDEIQKTWIAGSQGSHTSRHSERRVTP